MIRMVRFGLASRIFEWALFSHTGEQYSAVEKTSPKVDVWRVAALKAQLEPQSFWRMLFRDCTFFVSFVTWDLKVSDLSKVALKYVG